MDLSNQNKKHWQNYSPGKIPSPQNTPPEKILKNIKGKILDVGVGDGSLAEDLAKKGFDVFGIDVAKNIIRENKKRKTSVNYSVQDITKKTIFSDNTFDLVIFKYTLTNIHKESWESVGNEIFRILKPQGLLWIFEPLVSDSYKERYKLSSYFVSDKNCAYVFSEKDLARKIKTKNDLQKAITEKKSY